MFAGCGTAHYFLPPEPLDEGEWQLSVAWHYDFSGLPSTGAFPHLNAYAGLSDDALVGFGFVLPFFISHASLAAYTPESPDNYWIAWTHVKLLTGHDNPGWEMGGAFSMNEGGTSHMLSFGLSAGKTNPFRIGQPEGGYAGHTTAVVKYGIGGRDFGVDLVHYVHSTKPQMEAVFPVWPPTRDTVVSFAAGEALEIVRLDEPRSIRYREFRLVTAIVRNEGDTVFLLGDRRPYPDLFWQPDLDFDEWLGEDLRLMWYREEWLVVDLEELERQVRSGEAFAIMRGPKRLVERFRGMNSWLVDNSIGIAVFAWPE